MAEAKIPRQRRRIVRCFGNQGRYSHYRVQRPDHPLGRRRGYVIARREPCYHVRCQARYGCSTAVESGRACQSRLLSQLCHQEEKSRSLAHQYPDNQKGRRTADRLRFRFGRRIWTVQMRPSALSRIDAQEKRLAQAAQTDVESFQTESWTQRHLIRRMNRAWFAHRGVREMEALLQVTNSLTSVLDATVAAITTHET